MSSDHDPVVTTVQRAYGHLVPETGAEVDLQRALAVAPQEESPSSIVLWGRRLAIPVAASLLAAAAWWWGTHREPEDAGRPRSESAARPDEPKEPAKVEEKPPPSVVVRVAADGTVRYSLALGRDRFPIESNLSFGDEAKGPETMKALAEALRTLADGVSKPDVRGASGLRLVLESEASARWPWVNWVIQAGTIAKIADVVYASPSDATLTVAQPLPTDAGAGAPASPSSTLHVTLFAVGDDACDLLRAGGGVETKVAVRGQERLEVGSYAVRPALPADPRRQATLDALSAAVKRALAAAAPGTPLACVIDAPNPRGACVPFGVVFDVLATLRASGVARVQLTGIAPPLPLASVAGALPARTPLDEKRIVGVRLDRTTLASVCTFLSTVTGLNFVVSPGATALDVRVTLAVEEISARLLLDVVTSAHGLRWSLHDHGVVRILAKSE